MTSERAMISAIMAAGITLASSHSETSIGSLCLSRSMYGCVCLDFLFRIKRVGV